jgi:copper(I)-binding protein
MPILTSWRGAALAAALLATPVVAHHAGEYFQAGDMRVSHAWTVETAATSDAVEVFLTIANDGEAADRLVGASARFSGPALFQAPVVDGDGVLQVREVPAIEIAAGQSVTFQPGGIRIVLPDVQRHFSEGDHFHMVLEFETAGPLEIDVDVEDRDHRHDHEHEPAS